MPIRVSHIVNFSGGKDSAATVELAIQHGEPFRLVMADTGHEAPITIDHAHRVGERFQRETGSNSGLEIVRADFTDRIRAKREYVREQWPKKGVPADVIERALAALHPTGNPYLDLCIWKGRFPSSRAQFCTQELKAEPIWRQVIEPALHTSPVVQWLGVRRDESANRANALMFHKVRTPGLHPMVVFRPIIHWTAANVFSYLRARGAPINPLYRQGMGRVGCFPCIHATKHELRQISLRFPEAFERLEEWEAMVAEASKRGAATFFASDKTPEGAAMARAGITGERGGPQYPRATAVAKWAETDKGGRQLNWLQRAEDEDAAGVCSSQYGLCE